MDSHQYQQKTAGATWPFFFCNTSASCWQQIASVSYLLLDAAGGRKEKALPPKVPGEVFVHAGGGAPRRWYPVCRQLNWQMWVST